jgi:lipopolysaccharide export system permease protein
LIAAPLGLTARRRRRGVSLGVGIIILLIYHYLIQLGEGFSGYGRVSPWITLWLPFVAYSAFGMWCTYVTNSRPGENPFSRFLNRIDDLYGRIIRVGQTTKAPA